MQVTVGETTIVGQLLRPDPSSCHARLSSFFRLLDFVTLKPTYNYCSNHRGCILGEQNHNCSLLRSIDSKFVDSSLNHHRLCSTNIVFSSTVTFGFSPDSDHFEEKKLKRFMETETDCNYRNSLIYRFSSTIYSFYGFLRLGICIPIFIIGF